MVSPATRQNTRCLVPGILWTLIRHAQHHVGIDCTQRNTKGVRFPRVEFVECLWHALPIPVDLAFGVVVGMPGPPGEGLDEEIGVAEKIIPPTSKLPPLTTLHDDLDVDRVWARILQQCRCVYTLRPMFLDTRLRTNRAHHVAKSTRGPQVDGVLVVGSPPKAFCHVLVPLGGKLVAWGG